MADRFQLAVSDSIGAVMRRPSAGSPRRLFDNPALGGLRTWAVKGFDHFRIYYLVHEETVIVVRVLHGKRDIGAILEKQEIDDSDAD